MGDVERPMLRFINSDGRVFEEQDDGRSCNPLWAGFDEDILLIVYACPDGRTFRTVPHPRAEEATAVMFDTTLDPLAALDKCNAMLSERTPEVERAIEAELFNLDLRGVVVAPKPITPQVKEGV
jgi:hypothetical protein